MSKQQVLDIYNAVNKVFQGGDIQIFIDLLLNILSKSQMTNVCTNLLTRINYRSMGFSSSEIQELELLGLKISAVVKEEKSIDNLHTYFVDIYKELSISKKENFDDFVSLMYNTLGLLTKNYKLYFLDFLYDYLFLDNYVFKTEEEEVVVKKEEKEDIDAKQEVVVKKKRKKKVLVLEPNDKLKERISIITEYI